MADIQQSVHRSMNNGVSGAGAPAPCLCGGEERDRLVEALGAARVISFEWDLTTDLVARSPNADEIFGPDATHGTGSEFFSRVHAQDREALTKTLRALSPAKPEYAASFRYLRASDGKELALEDMGQAEFDTSGKLSKLRGFARDVTDQRRAEEALHSVALFLEEDPFPLARVNAQGELLFANRAASGLLAEWRCTIGTQVPEVVRLAVQEALAAKTSRELEATVGKQTISFSLAPLSDRGYVNLYGRDVTQQKRDQAELRRAKDLSDAASRISTALHSTLQTDEIVAKIVSEGAAALGSETAAISQREGNRWRVCHVHGLPSDLVGSWLTDETERHAVLAVETGEVVPVEDAFHDPRFNRDHFHRYNIRSVLTAPVLIRGELFGVFFLNYHSQQHEFTPSELNFARQLAAAAASALENARLFENQRRAEEALRESEMMFRLIFTESSVGKAEADPVTGRFLRVNEALSRITGYSQAELLERTITDITHPEELVLDRERFRRLVSGEVRSYTCEKRYVRPGGGVVWAEVTVNLVRNAVGQPQRTIAVIQDVTTRKEAEQALRRSEERFRVAQELSLDGFTILGALRDETGRIMDFRWLYVNPAAARLLRHAPERLLGQRLLEVLPGNAANADLFNRYVRVVETGEPHDCELSYDADGIRGWFRNMTVKLGDGIAVCFSDITARKRAEEALRDREERLRQAAELVGLCTYSWKPLTGELTWDPGIKPMWGLPADADISLEVWRAGLHPGDRAMIEERVARCLDPGGDGLYEAEYRVNGVDGVERWVSTRARTSFAEGKPVLHLGVVVEITARKRAEEALRESEERFRRLADGTPVLIWVHDQTGELRFVNRAWLDFFGVTIERLMGENWQPLIHPEDAAYVDRFLASHTERREFRAQARVRRADGEWRWVESVAVPRFAGSGEFLGMAGSSVDVTDRKAAEAVLARDREELEELVRERTAKLQELVNELEHFSYTITHDMRAPLRAMRGFAEIMTETDEELSDQERRKFTRRIITAAERMDGLITDALHYSRLVRQELPMGAVDLEKLLNGMLDTYPEFQIETACIQVEALPRVLGNEAALTQCFSNLLGNAVKFAKPDQRPNVRVWGERLHENGHWVKIWVEDQGIGISQGMLPRVFDMFARGSSPNAGNGIGLALVRKVVDRMGGQIGVESEVGKGSRFWVQLREAGARTLSAR